MADGTMPTIPPLCKRNYSSLLFVLN